MTSFKHREITPLIEKSLRVMPVVVLTGMRQTGKTTLIKNAASLKHRRYITLDDFATLEAARNNPEGLLENEEPLTIDEAQKCPELLTAIKREVDRHRVPGRFLLSGSANFSLLRGVADTLAGRASYVTLHPFTQRELSAKTSRMPFVVEFLRQPGDVHHRAPERLKPGDVLRGGMPAASQLTHEEAAIWFRGYEQTYLERDLRDLSQVGDLVSFRTLLKLAALRSGQVLNISDLARDARLSNATANRYLGLAETSFVVTRVAPFLSNRASRLIKSPKLFFSDSGLACFMAGTNCWDDNAAEPLAGAMLETYVAQNILSTFESYVPGARISFWSIQGRHEVDFIAEAGKDCLALEVKWGTRWTDRDLASLRAFLSATPACVAALLAYNGTQTVQLGPKLWAVPLGLLLE